MGLRFVFAGVLLVVGQTNVWASEGAVEASGEAVIRGGDTTAAKTAAKTAALADALKHCVEHVVGIEIKSEFTSEQAETVSGQTSEMYQKVQDSLMQKSEGFIQNYDIISEQTTGDVLQVRVRATVFESKVKAEIRKLADLLQSAGNPKLMLVMQEMISTPDGGLRIAGESILGSYVERELLSRGFEIRGQNLGRKVASGSLKEFDQFMNDTAAAMHMARTEGADILIFGRVEIKNQGKITDTAGIEALRDQIRLEIFTMVRGLNTATGEILSSKPVQMKSMGTSEERAIHRAFKGNGQNLVHQVFGDLLEDLKSSFKKTAEQGQQYVVQLGGVTSYRRQGQMFIELLKGVTGVSIVSQKSFDSGAGNIDIDVSCKCSTTELQQRIFNATEKAEVLRSLDLAGVSGKRLSFKL